MSISVLLRLAPTALDEGELAGWAQLVETGEVAVVRSAADLVSFLASHRGTPVRATPVHPTSQGDPR